MKLAYIAVPAFALLTSCSWTGRQTHDFMGWADRTMPTYDAKPTAATSGQSQLIKPDYSAAATSNGLTKAQATSATEGGNTRPLPNVVPRTTGIHAPTVTPPGGPTYNVVPSAPAPSAYPTAPSPSAYPASASPSSGRRVPAGMLPPSAIQPVPYGQQKAAPQPIDTFPAEYKNVGKPGFDTNQDTMIPAPPI